MADNNTELNVVRDWDFSVNLSGLQAPSGKGANILPEGYYKVTISDMYVNPDRNPDRIIIKVTVAEGPFKGSVRTTGLSKPKSADDKVRYYWRGVAESAGYSPGQLDNGEIQLSAKAFINKTAHVHYVPKVEDDANSYETVLFLAPQEWVNQSTTFEALAAQGGFAGAGGNTVTTRTLGGATNTVQNKVAALGASSATVTPASGNPAIGGVTDKNAILSKLGVALG